MSHAETTPTQAGRIWCEIEFKYYSAGTPVLSKRTNEL
jgi:hypothetical protein